MHMIVLPYDIRLYRLSCASSGKNTPSKWHEVAGTGISDQGKENLPGARNGQSKFTISSLANLKRPTP
jgi:hypothetical protein